MPKGLAEDGEDLARAAVREFHEELGVPVTTPLAPLTACRQPSGKLVQAWMTEADPDLTPFRSNLFKMEWPPGSGKMRAFPEVDRAAWFSADEALARIHRGQRPILLEALTRLGVPPPE